MFKSVSILLVVFYFSDFRKKLAGIRYAKKVKADDLPSEHCIRQSWIFFMYCKRLNQVRIGSVWLAVSWVSVQLCESRSDTCRATSLVFWKIHVTWSWLNRFLLKYNFFYSNRCLLILNMYTSQRLIVVGFPVWLLWMVKTYNVPSASSLEDQQHGLFDLLAPVFQVFYLV